MADIGLLCDCPLGHTGPVCEEPVHITVPEFSGTSHLRHPGLGDSALIWLQVSLSSVIPQLEPLQVEAVFRPLMSDGLLIYNGNRNDGQGDFMALVLR